MVRPPTLPERSCFATMTAGFRCSEPGAISSSLAKVRALQRAAITIVKPSDVYLHPKSCPCCRPTLSDSRSDQWHRPALQRTRTPAYDVANVKHVSCRPIICGPNGACHHSWRELEGTVHSGAHSGLPRSTYRTLLGTEDIAPRTSYVQLVAGTSSSRRPPLRDLQGLLSSPVKPTLTTLPCCSNPTTNLDLGPTFPSRLSGQHSRSMSPRLKRRAPRSLSFL